MKKILLKSTVALALSVGFVGCGAGDDLSSGGLDFDYLVPDKKGGTSVKNALKVTKTNSGIKIDWSRTGKALYGYYTQLEVANDIGTFRIATTNKGNKISILCNEQYKESDNTLYRCKPDNVSFFYPLRLKVGSNNIVQERAGVNKTNKTIKLGNISE